MFDAFSLVYLVGTDKKVVSERWVGVTTYVATFLSMRRAQGLCIHYLVWETCFSLVTYPSSEDVLTVQGVGTNKYTRMTHLVVI